MDLTEIIQEICENHPDKMVVDISDYENADHQLYKKLYEDICVAKRKLEEENASLMFDKMNAEKENAELLMENGVIFNDEMKRRIMQATKSDVYCPYCHKNNGYRMTSGFVYTFKMED